MSRFDTISQWSQDKIGVAVVEINEYTDADGDVTVTILREEDNTEVVTAAVADRDDVGLYSYTLELSSVTGTKGIYKATWDWEVGGDARTFEYEFEIVDIQPFFDSLDAEQKQFVDNVYHAVSDAFDSTVGGPYLWELPQATFGFETVARLMAVDAITYINFSPPKAFVPPYTVGADSPKPFPPSYYGLLERATKYHLFLHLATSYIEIPEAVNVNVARLDRRDYYERWMRRADHEKEELDHMIKMLKRDLRFGVMSRSMLLAGGIFPVSYLNPARPRWPYVLSRFY
jgi:hypothetical protein